MKRKLTDLENQVRQPLKAFGIKLGAWVQRSSFPDRVRDAVAHDPVLTASANRCCALARCCRWSTTSCMAC